MKQAMLFFNAAIGLIITFSVPAIALEKKPNNKLHAPEVAAISYAKYVEGLKPSVQWTSQRKPAGNELLNPSDAFRAKRDAFFKIKTADELALFLDTLEVEYKLYKDNDLKFFASRLLLLKPMRSFLYRTEKLYSGGGLAASNTTFHATLRSLFSQIDFMFPRSQWSAALDYIQIPTQSAEQFKTYTDVQKFTASLLFQRVSEFSLELRKILDSIGNGEGFVVDLASMIDSESFLDKASPRRYRLFGKAEILFTLAKIDSWRHRMLLFCAYNIEDVGKVSEVLLQWYSAQDLFSGELSKSSKRKAKILRSYRKYLTIHEEKIDGRDFVKTAFSYLKQSVVGYRTAWQALQARSKDDLYVIPSARVMPYQDIIEAKIAAAEGMIGSTGFVGLRSQLDSTVAEVNISLMFNDPPADLKDLLPKQFESSDSMQKKYGKKFKNYRAGQAIAWDEAIYSKYIKFDIAQDKKRDPMRVRDAIRVFGESWAGFDLATGLSFFVK